MKKAIFFEEKHEHDLEIIDDTYTLYYSDNENWLPHIRKTIAMQMKNTGNGFQFNGQGKKNFLGYDEAVYMYILLAAEKDYNIEVYKKEKTL